MNESPSKYDVIGDIHGHADALRALLAKLGYRERDGVYAHPERQAVFVGDFLDRGPKIRETLQIVRAMVDRGQARTVLGNHEINAIRYHTKGTDGNALRPHHETDEAHKHFKNFKQHRSTLEQVARPYPEEWAGWLAWFKTLPLSLDLGGLRVVHAAWCEDSIRFIAGRRFDDPALLLASSRRGSPENEAVSALLNGPELTLPDGHSYHDKEGHHRIEIRARWFGRESDPAPATYRSLVFPPSHEPPDIEVSAAALAALPSYGEHEPPVIFGHYWMPPVSPRCLARNAVCVDYSVAAKGGGLLTAYRWSGETVLTDANLVTEPRPK